MKKKIQLKQRATTKLTARPPGSPAERKLKIVYWMGAIVLVGVKIYAVLHGIG